LALAKSYLANLGKSLYYSAKTAVANEMPVTVGTYEKNKEQFRSGTEYVKSFVTRKGSTTSHGVNTMISTFLKDVDDLKKNAFEDLRSGKINNFDREMQAHEKEYNFGGDGDSGFNFNFGDDDESDATFSINEDSNSISIETKATETGSNIRTKAMMETIIDSAERSANYMVGNSRKINSMQMSLMSQMHTEMIKSMSDTNNLLTNLVEFQNNQMVDHMNKTLSFYDNVIAELREIKTGLAPKQEEFNRATGFEDVMSGSGLNMKAYGELIKKNFGTWFQGTSLGMATSFAKLAGGKGGIMGAIKNNPLGFISDLIVSGLMPNSLKLAMGSFDKSLAGLFSSMILGFNKMKGDYSSPFKQMLGSIFGIDTAAKRGIDTSKFHRGVMQYNGRADKALTEVIPALLSNIYAAVSKSEKVMLYNYTTGKFVESSSMLKDHSKRIRQGITYEMSGVRDAMKNKLSKVSGGSSEFMMDELDTFLEHLAVKGQQYNPYKQTHASDMDGLNLRDQRSYRLIRAAFMSMPKGMQNRIAHEIIKGRGGSSKAVESIEQELRESGLGIGHGGLDAPRVSSKYSYGTTNTLLKDIKNILTEGIKVVQIGSIQASSNAIKRITGRKLDTTDYGGGHGTGGSGSPTPTPPGDHSPQGKNDVEKSYGDSDDEIMKKMSVNDVNNQRTGFRKFIEAISKEATLKGKYRVFKQGMAPANLVSKGMNRLDEMIHSLIFGSPGKKKSSGGGGDDDGDGPGDGSDGPQKSGFFSRMTQRISNAIDKSLKWVETRILNPLHEKFFGEEGIFTKFQEKFTPFIEKIKDFAKSKFDKMKEVLLGSQNQEGFYTGGLFADVGNSFKDYSNQMRHFFTGAAYKKANGQEVKENKETSVFAYVKKYSKNIMESVKTGLFGAKEETVDEEGNLVTKRKGDGLLSGVMNQLKSTFKMFDSLFKSKEGESDADVEKGINQWKKEFKGFLPKGLATGLLGMGASVLLPGGPLLWGMLASTTAFAGHSKKFREFLFGNDQEGRPGVIPPHYKKILLEVKNSMPSILGGGMVGLGASLLLPGVGPLVGLTLGSAVGYAAKSKRMQEWLFGNGDDKKGVISPQLREKMKTILPAMGAGGILGMGASLLLPGGPLLGLTIGSAVGFAAKSSKFQAMLFGETDEKGNFKKGLISPEMRTKIKSALPRGLSGALFGSMTGMLTGSPLVGAMVGASVSILTSSEKFKEMMFGTANKFGKKVGGLLGNVRDFVRDEFLSPFKHWVTKKGIVIKDWFENSIKTPFVNVMSPLKDAFGIIGKNIKNSWSELKDSFKKAFVDTFNNNIGIPLKNFVTKNITDPLKNMFSKFFNAIGKGLGAILTAPAKGLALFANSIIEADKKKDDKTLKSMGMSGATYNPYDIDVGMNLDPKDRIDQDYKDMVIENRKKKLKEKLDAYDRQHGLIELNPDDKFDMEYRDSMREAKDKENAAPRRDSFDNYFEAQMEKHRQAQQHTVGAGLTDAFSNANSMLPSPEEMKAVANGDPHKKGGRIPLNLQMFASDKGGLKMDLGDGDMGGRARGGILDQIKGILISYGSKLKSIDESTQSINAQLKQGIVVKNSHQGDDKRGLTLVGTFDYDRFTAHNTTMLEYTRDIRNEVMGQLDGVGYNVETMANVLVDTFGSPSVAAKGMRGLRGNRRRRGFFGKILDIIQSPFTFMKNMFKTMVMKPVTALWGQTKKLFTYIPQMLSKGITLFGKGVYKLINLPLKAIGGVAKAIGGIGNSMIKFFKSDFFKSIGRFASTLVDGLVVKPLKGLFNVVGQVTKGLWTITKGVGGLLKDSFMGMINLAKDAIPATIKGVRALGRGVVELTKGLWQLTTTVGKAVWGMAKFTAGMIGSAFKSVGRLLGFGKKTRDIMGSTGLSGKPVYVVGGALDRIEKIKEVEIVKEVEKVKEVDILKKIEECVRVMGCGGKNTNNHTAAKRMGMSTSGGLRHKMNLQMFAASPAAHVGDEGHANPVSTPKSPTALHLPSAVAEEGAEGAIAKGGKPRTFKARSIFAKAGAFIGRMGSNKWNDVVPRIASIQNLTKNVKTEEDYHNASIGLLNEMTVSNIQLLDATNRMGTDEKGKSFLDTLKDISSVIKNGWPLLAGLMAPMFKNVVDSVKGLGTKLKKLWNGDPDIDTPDGKPRGPKPKVTPGEVASDIPGGLIVPGGGKAGKTPWYKKLNPFKGKGAAAATGGAAVVGSKLGILGKAGKFMKRIPVLGTAIGVGTLGMSAYNLSKANTEEERDSAKKSIWGTLGGIGGGIAAGAGLGALGGSIVPGAGTVVGGLVGGVAGAFLGEAGVRKLYEKKDEIADWTKEKYGQIKNFTVDTASAFWNSAPVETVRNLTTGFVNMTSEILSGVYDAGAEVLKSLGALTGRLWKKFTKFVSEKWDSWIVEPVKKFGEWIKDSWGKAKDWVAEKWDSWIVQPVKDFGEWIKEAWNTSKEWIGEKWNSWIVDPLEKFGNFVSEKWTAAKTWLGEVWEEYVPEPVKEFVGFVGDSFKTIGDWVGQKWDSWIAKPISRALGAIREGFVGVGDWIGEKWNDWIVSPLKNFGTGMKNLWNKTTTWVGDMWDNIFGDRGKSAKEAMESTGESIGDDTRKAGSKLSRWLDSMAVADEKGGGDPTFDRRNDLSYAINGAISGTDATASDLGMIKSIADKFGINPHLWLALAETESHLYSKAANSSSSARGWGQLLEGTAKGIYEKTLKLGSYNHDMAFDKNTNATMSIAYLRQMFDMFNGDGAKAILAYNVGPGNVQKGIGVNDNGGYGAGHGSEYLQKVLRNLKENTGMDLKDVVDPSKMSSVDYAMLGATSGAGAGVNAATSGGLKEYTMASTLGAMGTFLGGDKVKEMYGFDPSEFTSSLDKELMKKSDPFYAAIMSGGAVGAAGGDYNAATKTYTNSEINAVKSRNSSNYSMVTGDNDVHEFVAERLNNLAKAYGKPLSINSGHRSDAEQLELIAKWKAEHPGASEAERKKWVADPGRSNHAVGIAADISGWIQQLSVSELAKYGLYRPMDWEPWHFEPIETKLYGRSRDELMPIYGTPMTPNPNLGKYISSEFGGGSGGSKALNTTGINVPAWLNESGGGDPAYDNKFGPPDITQYTQRVQDVVDNNTKDSNETYFVKMIELLTVIANGIEKLVDISDESKEILKAYFGNISKQYPTSKQPKQSKPIVANTSPTPSNPVGGSATKRNDKSSVVAQIAKGTFM